MNKRKFFGLSFGGLVTCLASSLGLSKSLASETHKEVLQDDSRYDYKLYIVNDQYKGTFRDYMNGLDNCNLDNYKHVRIPLKYIYLCRKEVFNAAIRRIKFNNKIFGIKSEGFRYFFVYGTFMKAENVKGFDGKEVSLEQIEEVLNGKTLSV